MVTGDNLETAKAISLDAGIITAADASNEYACMEGKDFREAVGGLIEVVDPQTNKKIEQPKDLAKFSMIAS